MTKPILTVLCLSLTVSSLYFLSKRPKAGSIIVNMKLDDFGGESSWRFECVKEFGELPPMERLLEEKPFLESWTYAIGETREYERMRGTGFLELRRKTLEIRARFSRELFEKTACKLS